MFIALGILGMHKYSLWLFAYSTHKKGLIMTFHNVGLYREWNSSVNILSEWNKFIQQNVSNTFPKVIKMHIEHAYVWEIVFSKNVYF